MRRQAEINPVPDTGEFRVMVDLFGMHRDAREEAERLGKILEAKALLQRLAVGAQRPPFGNVHWPALSSSDNYFLSYRPSRS